MDSMLCRFKAIYPVERIDSVRHLLEDKESQMRQIVEVLDRQQDINDMINSQVPVIIQNSVQEQPKKLKRKGFLGIFGKKEEAKITVSTTMLRSLNRNMIPEQQEQRRRLSEHADSLAMRNAELNRQLQELIIQIDKKIQADLQKRGAEIADMRKKTFFQISGLAGFILILLMVSYIIIHRNIKSRERGRRRLEESLRQNNILLELLRKSNIRNSRTIPVIAMTARGDNEKDALLGNGFTGCIFKPFSTAELLKCLSSLMDTSPASGLTDFTPLISEVSDKCAVLEKLIESSRRDMEDLRQAMETDDRKQLRETVHRMWPLWELLRKETRLGAYRELLKDKNAACEVIRRHTESMIGEIENLIIQSENEIRTIQSEEQDTDSGR